MQTSVQPPERQIVRTFSPDSGMTRVLPSVNMDEPHELSVSRCQQQATPWHVCVRLLQSHCKLGRCTFRVQNAMLGERHLLTSFGQTPAGILFRTWARQITGPLVPLLRALGFCIPSFSTVALPSGVFSGYARSVVSWARTPLCQCKRGCLSSYASLQQRLFFDQLVFRFKMASALWAELRAKGLQELAPVLLSNGVRSIDDVSRLESELVSAGVAPTQIAALIGRPSEPAVPEPVRRTDLPPMPTRKRASFADSMAAARPENRESAMKRLHQDVLAQTTQGPLSSRVKTWHEWCRAWGVLPFPLDANNISCAAASMKAGSYRSCAQYFSAAIKHQERNLHIRVDDVLRQLIKDCRRSILRGLGPESLKDAFDVAALRPLLQLASEQVGPWDVSDIASMTDGLLLSSWFMLREIEFGGLRRAHLYLSSGKIHLLLPVQKTAASNQTAGFAFPDRDGKELKKSAVVSAFRCILTGAGVETTRPDEEEVEALKRAAPPPDGVLVQTVCGWPYGIRNFLRVVPSDFSEEFDDSEFSDVQMAEIVRAVTLVGSALPFRVMAGSASEPTLAEIAVQAGAGSEITTYLDQRGLRSAGALALIASDVDQLDNVLVAPLLAGWRPDPADPGIQLSDDEKPIAKAVLRFMWVLATEARKRAAASAVTTSTTTSPVNGELSLSFQANGLVNPLAKRSRSTKLSVEDGILREEPDQEDDWVPRGSLSIIDGLNSIRWIYILCEVGPETWVHKYFDAMIKRSRIKPNLVDKFKTYFERASWKLCSDLRSNKTFKEASQAIIQDVSSFQEALIRDEPAASTAIKRKVDETPHGDASQTIPAWKRGKGKDGKNSKGGGRKGSWKGKDGNKDNAKGSDWQRPWYPNPGWRRQDCDGLDAADGEVPEVATGSQPAPASTEATGHNAIGPALANLASDSASGKGAPSLEPTNNLLLPPLPHIKDVIILSMFDGMGSAAFAVQQLGIRIRALFTWEVDTASHLVSKSLFKGLRFERGQGRSGPTGKLFQVCCDFVATLEKALPTHHFHIIVENVVMTRREDVDFFSERLKAVPTMMCSSDFGLISRPRLFWTRLDFAKIKLNPLTGKPLKWGKHNGHNRLYIEPPRDPISNISMRGLQFHDDIVAGRRLLPCLTTPATSESGREAPRGMRGPLDPEVKRRWLENHRQYAPWHYSSHAMVVAKTGERMTLPAELKEQCHHFHVGATRLQNISPRDRHKMLGNSWHIGVIKFILWLTLASLAPTTAERVWDDTGTDDPVLSRVFEVARQQPLSLSREVFCSRFVSLPPSDSEWEHWLMTADIEHPLLTKPRICQALQTVYDRLRSIGEDIQVFRESVLQSVSNLVQERKQVSAEWFAGLPSHVRAAYTLPDDQGFLQIPVFLELLRGCGFPEVEELSRELSDGMPMIGHLRPTMGWLPRTDQKYTVPISFEAFRRLNAGHVKERLDRRRVDDEWRTMLSEVLEEVREGRMEGPFAAPESWKHKTVPVKDEPGFESLLSCPDAEPCIAWAFSVVQEGSDGQRKVRRCEDYRRSFHNDTVEAFDVPPHDDISVYVSLIRHLAAEGEFAMIWAQDLHSAYRQYPVADPSHCYVIVMTPDGPTLWRHRVMPFGATASVFHFNKITDALLWLARTLLLIPAIHYVDDLGSVDPAASSDSSFRSFDCFCELLGYRLKVSKRQPPDTLQTLQGVIVRIQDAGVTVEPSESRVSKLCRTLREALLQDRLTSDEAARLAGKLGFLSTSLWGQLGKSLTRPIYGRSQGSKDGRVELNPGLRASMECLLTLLATPIPRYIPFARSDTPVAVLYADAFFKLGDRRWSVCDSDLPTHWPTDMHLAENGWGFLCRAQGQVTAGLSALQKGYGRDVSRGDVRLVQDRGWPLLCTDLGPLWQIVERVAVDSNFAVSAGVEDQLHCRDPKRLRRFAQSSQEPCRLQRWLQLQREHLQEGPLPDKKRRREAAQEALQRILKDGSHSEEVFLPPQDLLHVLKDSVLCPAFSLELLRLLQQHVFCDGFEGVRRQFFQNQILHVYAELAVSVRESYKLLTETDEVLDPQLTESVFMFEAVLNRLPGQLEPAPDEGLPAGEDYLLFPLGEDEVSPADKGSRFQVVPVSDILPVVVNREVEAIWAACRQDGSITPFVDDLLFGSAGSIQATAEVVEVEDAELNQQQIAAVARASAAKLTLVQGPPGTGKSEVAAAIVQQWMKDETESVLLATSTHAAKDVLGKRLRRRQIQPSLRVRSNSPNTARKAEVFVETVYMSGSAPGRTVPKVLLDESSQITTAAALVALTHGCEKLVLIGDPQQLGPVSSFGSAQKLDGGLDAFAEERRSFFEILADKFRLQPHRLQVQYRMDQRLCDYPSQRFYNGELQTAASVGEGGVTPQMLPAGITFKAGIPGHPVVFLDTSAIEGCREQLVPFFGSISIHNRMEAQIVAELLRGFQAASVEAARLCVLTAYKAQDSLLDEVIHGGSSAERLRKRKSRSTMIREQGVDPLEKESHPRIYTVDGFQGNESDYVFYSAVRSGGTATGFSGNPQRLCVLLTRARRGLIVVGSRDTLQHTEEWQRWLDSADKQEFTLDDELVAKLQRREVAQRGPL
ncbi:unnamed protein product [Symbiodinium sp. KB8]|nr:unnamed protein product [Symbiodinium sp. KB8]